MRTYLLEHETTIAASVKEVWQFFSDPHNLAKITPGYMKFAIVNCPDVPEIYDGMLIEYRVRPVWHIPVKWISLIKKVQPFQCFVDAQVAGPYSFWEHTHTFHETPAGTLMHDAIRYALPLGPLGTFAHALFLRKQLDDIFSYRSKMIRDLFPAT